MRLKKPQFFRLLYVESRSGLSSKKALVKELCRIDSGGYMEEKIIESIKIAPPNISKDTLAEMAKFFMKTSTPRIVAKNSESNKQ